MKEVKFEGNYLLVYNSNTQKPTEIEFKEFTYPIIESWEERENFVLMNGDFSKFNDRVPIWNMVPGEAVLKKDVIFDCSLYEGNELVADFLNTIVTSVNDSEASMTCEYTLFGTAPTAANLQAVYQANTAYRREHMFPQYDDDE